mgnify:CR=1 FL=1
MRRSNWKRAWRGALHRLSTIITVLAIVSLATTARGDGVANVLTSKSLPPATVAVIDPACSYGDAWCDLAMMRLFGGFPVACEHAWKAHRSEDDTEGRVAIYQLYHQLNHLYRSN